VTVRARFELVVTLPSVGSDTQLPSKGAAQRGRARNVGAGVVRCGNGGGVSLACKDGCRLGGCWWCCMAGRVAG
jgi:hypothetical protein